MLRRVVKRRGKERAVETRWERWEKSFSLGETRAVVSAASTLEAGRSCYLETPLAAAAAAGAPLWTWTWRVQGQLWRDQDTCSDRPALPTLTHTSSERVSEEVSEVT